MSVIYLLLLVAGLFALIKGSEITVKIVGALSWRWNINSFVLGVIILGMGTSIPEWAVSAVASVKELPDLAVSNIFGSNIFNILLVLGFILLMPISKERVELIKKDIWFLIATSFVLIPIMWDQFLSRLDALVLSTIFLIYIGLCFYSKKPKKAGDDFPKSKDKDTEAFSIVREALWLILGFVLLIGGSYLTVISASELGKQWGLSDRLVGVLMISVGTSLPELMTAVIAVLKQRKNMALGGIIGSNIFNTFAIFSTAGWIFPANITSKIVFIDLPVLLFVHLTLLFLLLLYSWKWVKVGLPYLFFLAYIGYIGLLLSL